MTIQCINCCALEEIARLKAERQSTNENEYLSGYGQGEEDRALLIQQVAKLEEELAKHQTSEFHPDWSMLEACRERNKEISAMYKELKDEINRVWYLAYPESPQDDKDVAKMRVFNLYQDLKDTRLNYKNLHIAYNKMDAERK